MQIVIDIPDRIYKIIQNNVLNMLDEARVEEAIKNGTPLPAHHGRLIDADALAYELKHFGEICLDEAMTIIEADTESEDKE